MLTVLGDGRHTALGLGAWGLGGLRKVRMAGSLDLMLALFRHDGARPRRAMTEQLERQMRLYSSDRFRVASAARRRRTQRGNGEGRLPGIAASLSVMAPPGRARWWPSGTKLE